MYKDRNKTQHENQSHNLLLITASDKLSVDLRKIFLYLVYYQIAHLLNYLKLI